MLLVADDLYNVTGLGLGEILRGPQALASASKGIPGGWHLPTGESPLRLEPLDHWNLRGSSQLEGVSETWTSALVSRCCGGGEKRPGLRQGCMIINPLIFANGQNKTSQITCQADDNKLFVFIFALKKLFFEESYREMGRKILRKCEIDHSPINVPTARAQAFPMDRIGRLGHDSPSEPSADCYWSTRCSCAVVSTRWALTAAHCVSPRIAYVKYNARRPSSPDGDVAPVHYLYRHPGYKVIQEDEGRGMDVTLLHHDVGLVRTRVDMVLNSQPKTDASACHAALQPRRS
ncbi:hypothetical protein evm_009585 [Chilo suppressalis]|nr:hypothetical protein evm_009585 [Chilo suppressalis]